MNSLRNHLSIQGRAVGPGEPCFVIAEAGVNHDGDLARALDMVAAAAAAGADAVKFQAFSARRLVAAGTPRCGYQARNTGSDATQLDMLAALELDPAGQARLKARCDELGIVYLCSPFEEASADVLEAIGVPAYKIPSGEITNFPFLRHLARKGRPLILSTGMSGLGEVEAAVDAIREAGDPGLALLQCTSEYPAAPAGVNLRAMAVLAAAFGVPTGFSDHTEGLAVPLAAVALGACIVEKHFTLDRGLPGPDHRASVEPGELAALVRGIRTVEAAMGDGVKRPTEAERETARLVRKSLAAAVDIPAGSVITGDMLTTMRPGTGLPPAMLPAVAGRVARCVVPAGTVLGLEMLA